MFLFFLALSPSHTLSVTFSFSVSFTHLLTLALSLSLWRARARARTHTHTHTQKTTHTRAREYTNTDKITPPLSNVWMASSVLCLLLYTWVSTRLPDGKSSVPETVAAMTESSNNLFYIAPRQQLYDLSAPYKSANVIEHTWIFYLNWPKATIYKDNFTL